MELIVLVVTFYLGMFVMALAVMAKHSTPPEQREKPLS